MVQKLRVAFAMRYSIIQKGWCAIRFFIDTEFIEDGKTIELLSVGIAAEDGRELYLENSEADLSKAGPWVVENVIPHLQREEGANFLTRPQMAEAVIRFCNPSRFGKPQFWGYYADYDWVVLCQLFGTMMDLPEGWPMYCRDIKQFADSIGNPTLPLQTSTEHHALADALWNRKAYDFLVAQSRRSS